MDVKLQAVASGLWQDRFGQEKSYLTILPLFPILLLVVEISQQATHFYYSRAVSSKDFS